MRYLSVCSGIEAATVAWHPLGWEAAAFSEIDKFPRAVLSHHYPETPLHGDFTTIKGGEYGPVDLLVGGTPCQSFSVAGLRKGMDDPRGNLALGYLGLAARLNARWLVWENVPGVLSSNGGRDFGAFLGGLAELGYGFAYRVLDAQFFGVPQRRRRVFVVGYLGDWRRAAAVLFERHSLQGHPAPSREAGEGSATRVAPCLDSSFGRLQGASGQDANHGHGHLIPFDTTQITSAANYSRPKGDPMHPLAAGAHPPAIAFGWQNAAAQGDDVREELSPTLDKSKTPAIAIQERAVSENPDAGPQGKGWQENVAYTLEARHHVQAVAATKTYQGDRIIPEDGGEPWPTLPAQGCNNGGGGAILMPRDAMAVRRITPMEAERLQGFPDDYTLTPYRGKPAADGPRYKALGNSMAVPVMRWIGERIAMVEALDARTAQQEAA